MTIEAFAPAKINLTLHVTGQRADGYHLLDSLVVFADIGDRLRLDPGPELAISVTGPFAQGVPTDARNLCWRAAEFAGWTGHIHLEKNLPHGAGLGGGSADAAALLRAISHPGRGAETLGADIPVCLQNQASRMGGIGDVLSPVTLPAFPALLVNPGVQVPTKPVFENLATRNNPPMSKDLPHFPGSAQWAHWLKSQRNDLAIPAEQSAPQISTVLADLNCTGEVQLARMSGSGSTCFALYPTKKAADFAAYEIESAHPDWWIASTTLNRP